MNEKHFEVAETHHGPVVARKDNKAYTMALAYVDRVGLMEELYKVHTARSMDAIKAALTHLRVHAAEYHDRHRRRRDILCP